MPARVLTTDEEGNIDVPHTKLSRVNVRFPTEDEQAAGMTEVPRAMRLEEDVDYGK